MGLARVLVAAALCWPASVSAAEIRHETLDDGAEAIVLTGEIEQGDEDRFRELASRYPGAILSLESEGGALVPALEIGRLVRSLGYTTVVNDDGTCVSACALIWVAGTRRVLSSSANLGFHASYIDDGGVMVESGVANALVGHYLSQLDFSQDAVVFATFAPPSEVSWLTRSNSGEAGISFESFQAARQPRPGRLSIENKGATLPPPQPLRAIPPPLRTTSVAPRPSETLAVAPPPPPIQLRLAPTAPRGDTAAAIKDVFRSPGITQSAARAMGLKAPLVEPMSEHLRLIYANDRIIELISSEVDAARIDVTKDPEAVGTVLYRLSTKLVYSGAQRLSQRDVNRMFYFLAEATKRQDSNCVALTDTGRVNAAEFEAVAQLGVGALTEYLALLRKAMFAEADGNPGPVELDASQVEVAEKAWGEVLLDALEAQGGAERDRLMLALDDYDGADRVTQCELQKIMIPAVHEMDGLAGDWFRRIFLTYVTDSL